MNRRTFIASALLANPLFAATHVLAASGSTFLPRQWANDCHDIAESLRSGSLSVDDWRLEISKLNARFDPIELRHALLDQRLRHRGRALPSYPFKTEIRFIDHDGTARSLAFATALFSFRANDVITPHAHRNMVSAHMVVEGSFRVRTYNKISDEGASLIVTPSYDGMITLGSVSSIGLKDENIHWFVPQSSTAMTLDVIVSRLDPNKPAYAIDAIHPLKAHALGDGTLMVPKIGFEDAATIYTNRV